MLISNTNIIYSGLICYLFIIIFIGGLIVLLLRVASTAYQEQRRDFSKRIVIFFILFYLSTIMDNSSGIYSLESRTNLIALLDLRGLNIVIVILALLTLSLFILTKLLLDYKGITRVL